MKALLALALMGCASPSRGYSMSYTVVLSPDFTPQEQEIALQAVGQWERAIPALTLTTMVGPCPTEALCVRPGHTTGSIVGTDAPIGLTTYGDTQSATSTILVDLIAQVGPYGFDPAVVLQQTICHEVGHGMMGPEHLSCPGTLMCVEATQASPTLTPTDIAHFYAVRGM